MILVGGTGRSGTSIVKEVIARHPEAASLPFEYRFIIDPDGLVDFYTSFTASWSPYLADRRLKRLEHFLNRLAYEPFYHKWMGQVIRWFSPDGRIFSPRAYHGWALRDHLPNFEHHVRELMDSLVAFSFPATWVGTESYQRFPQIYHAPPRGREELAQILGTFVRNLITDLLRDTGKRFFVEDNTWNALFAKELIEILPDVKLVHVYRDPRDVVASFSHQRWSPKDKVKGALWYKDMMAYWFKLRTVLPPTSYYELSLEHFVASPETTLREICQFAGIAFHKAMLKVDLSHAHSGRWKCEYSEEEKIVVQEILKDVIRELGYDLETTLP